MPLPFTSLLGSISSGKPGDRADVLRKTLRIKGKPAQPLRTPVVNPEQVLIRFCLDGGKWCLLGKDPGEE